MNDEIKEIQGRLNYHKSIGIEPVYCEELITTGELQSLLDNITNLQKENERLKKLLNEEIYRRIKALKYINKNMICDALYPASKVDGENIANILNGGTLNGGDE